jgi:hypothetical protein
MQSSQPVSSSPQVSRSRWTAVWTIGGGIVIGILVSWFGITSWKACLNTFFPVKEVDLSTLKPSTMPLYLASSTHSDVTTTAEGDQSQPNQAASPQTDLDDASKNALGSFGISTQPWMKSAEVFLPPNFDSQSTSFLVITGDGEGDGAKRVRVIRGKDSQFLLDEEFDICSGAEATSTKDYFVTQVSHSPCEAFSESTDTYYDWSGKQLVSIKHNSSASEFSFSTEKDSGNVSLTFSKKCSSEGVPYDQIWDKNEKVLLKTSITGLVIRNIFHKLPTPLEVSCGEYYGGNIVDPQIGWPSFDGRFITVDLTNDDSRMQAKIDVAAPEKVTLESK